MGFRKDAWATVWEVTPKSDTVTQIRLSVSRKDKDTGEYVDDFSGFVAFIGTANAQKAAKLKERDRIRLGDTDVSTRYDKEKRITYTNYKCFSFEGQELVQMADDPAPAAVDEGFDEDNLPW